MNLIRQEIYTTNQKLKYVTLCYNTIKESKTLHNLVCNKISAAEGNYYEEALEVTLESLHEAYKGEID